VQVVVLVWFMFSLRFRLPLLLGLHFLGGFRDSAGTGSGRNKTEKHNTRRRQTQFNRLQDISGTPLYGVNSFYKIPC